MKQAVILIHGLYLHAVSTVLWERHLRDTGFEAHGFSYASLTQSLSHNAQELAGLLNSIDAEQIHFVGHSLGGLLALQTLHEFPDVRIKRVVLAGVPYKQAYVPTALEQNAIGHMIIGPGMSQWLKQKTIVPSPNIEIGVIAGEHSIGLGRVVAPGVPVPNDGTIAVAETRVPGMRDHIVLPVTHTEMLFSKSVMEQQESFLRTGQFKR